MENVHGKSAERYNEHEIHRELGTTPQTARNQALAENRSVLRRTPACPW
jgi:predicted transcriptional regulator